MAQQQRFAIPFDAGSQAVPQQLSDFANAYQQQYQALSNNVPLRLKMFGRGPEYQAALNKSWGNRLKDLVEMQKNMDAVMTPRNEVMADQALLEQAKQQGIVDQATPNYYQQQLPSMDNPTQMPRVEVPTLSREYLENRRKGTFGASDIGYAQKMFQNQAQFGAGLFNGQSGAPNALQGSIQATDAPFYVANPEAIINNLPQAMNTAITAGEKQNEFNREFPAQDALRKAQAYNQQTQGDVNKAEVPLRGAQTKQALAKASLDNRTNPNLRSGGGSDALGDAVKGQKLLAEQASAVLDTMAREGFIGKDGSFQPPGNEGGFFGVGGAPNQNKMARFNQLKNQYSLLNAAASGSGGSAPPIPKGGGQSNVVQRTAPNSGGASVSRNGVKMKI